jgi:hypothetical protein
MTIRITSAVILLPKSHSGAFVLRNFHLYPTPVLLCGRIPVGIIVSHEYKHGIRQCSGRRILGAAGDQQVSASRRCALQSGPIQDAKNNRLGDNPEFWERRNSIHHGRNSSRGPHDRAFGELAGTAGWNLPVAVRCNRADCSRRRASGGGTYRTVRIPNPQHQSSRDRLTGRGLLVAVHGGRRKRRQTHCDIFRPAFFWRAVADPLTPIHDDGLSGADINHAATVFDS